MSLNDFLEGARPKNEGRFSARCSICINPKLADEVEQYVAGRLDGSISHSIHYIWQNYFCQTYGMGDQKTLRHHIRLHLGKDL